MSSTVPVELVRIRRLICDRKLTNPAVPGSLLEELVSDAMDEVAREVGAGDIVQTGFATVGPTSTTITVATTYPTIRYLKQLIREIDGLPLQKSTIREIKDARAFGGGEFGWPLSWALTPAPDETFLLDVYPTPQDAMALTGIWEPVPSAVTQFSGLIFLSPTGLTAMRCLVASRALRSLSADKLAELGRGESYIGSLEEQAQLALSDEWQRMQQGNFPEHVVRARG